MRFALTSLVALALALGACATEPLPAIDSALRQRVANVSDVQSGAIASRSFLALGEVHGDACQQNARAPAEYEQARTQVRLDAARLGADAVADMVCTETGVDWGRNCWSVVHCVGDAVRWNRTVARARPYSRLDE